MTGTQVDNGNLLALVSSYTTGDGARHAMADVWFAKDVAAAPQLGELLAAPAAEVLPSAPPAPTAPKPEVTAHSTTPPRFFSDTHPAPPI